MIPAEILIIWSGLHHSEGHGWTWKGMTRAIGSNKWIDKFAVLLCGDHPTKAKKTAETPIKTPLIPFGAKGFQRETST